MVKLLCFGISLLVGFASYQLTSIYNASILREQKEQWLGMVIDSGEKLMIRGSFNGVVEERFDSDTDGAADIYKVTANENLGEISLAYETNLLDRSVRVSVGNGFNRTTMFVGFRVEGHVAPAWIELPSSSTDIDRTIRYIDYNLDGKIDASYASVGGAFKEAHIWTDDEIQEVVTRPQFFNGFWTVTKMDAGDQFVFVNGEWTSVGR